MQVRPMECEGEKTSGTSYGTGRAEERVDAGNAFTIGEAAVETLDGTHSAPL